MFSFCRKMMLPILVLAVPSLSLWACPPVGVGLAQGLLKKVSKYEKLDDRQKALLCDSLGNELDIITKLEVIKKLMVFIPPQPRRENVENTNKTRWMAHEHEDIGNQVKLKFPDGEIDGKDQKLLLPNGLELTLGQIIALAGDFYGVPGEPITQSYDMGKPEHVDMRTIKKQFFKSYKTLAMAQGVEKEIKAIYSLINEERTRILAALHNGRTAKDAYREIGDSFSAKWDKITGGKPWIFGKVPIPFESLMGRYMKLAKDNQDHFVPYAHKAYIAGHMLALEQAYKANKMRGEERRKRGLMEAYALDAYAAHFLTDSHAAGHLRTPRVQLNKMVTPSILGDLASKLMHDEDGHFGIKVTNKRGDCWTTFGDGAYFDAECADTRQYVQESLQLSLNEVYQVFESGDIPCEADFVALRLLPEAVPGVDNNTPLFAYDYEKNKLLRRDDLANLACGISSDDWKGWLTIPAFYRMKGDKRSLRLYRQSSVIPNVY